MVRKSAVQEEPSVEEALKWFPRQPGAFTFIGWKEHLFEFLVTHCGDLVLPTDIRSLHKGLERHIDDAAHFFFLWGLGTEVPRIEASHVVDDDSCRQELLDGWKPVVITRFRCPFGLCCRQTVFAHRTGGKELERGDEPVFAWARFEIEDFAPELFEGEKTAALTVHVAGNIHRTSMTKGLNVGYEQSFPPYSRNLAWCAPYVVESYIEEQRDMGGERVRMAVVGERESIWRPYLSRPFRPHFGYFRNMQKNCLTLPMPLKRGATIDLVIPILPCSREAMAAELAVGREKALAETLRFWDRQLARGVDWRIPEKLADSTFRNFPIQVMTAAEKRPEDGARNMNMGARNYEGIWSTPGAMLTAWGLDFLGHHEEAEAYMELYRTGRQQMAKPPGEFYAPHPGFLTVPPPYDNIIWVADHGAILWGAAVHALLTDDQKFLDRWLPVMLDAADWIRVQRRQTGHPGHKGLLPAGRATDDPTPGQWIWNDGWCHKGLVTLVELLERLGHPKAGELRAEAAEYRSRFLEILREACAHRSWKDCDGKSWPFVPGELTNISTRQGRHPFYLDCGPLFLGFSGLVDANDPLMDAALAWFTKGPAVRHYVPESDHNFPPVLVHEMSSCEPCYSWNTILRLERGERRELVEGLVSLLAGGQEPTILSGVETRHGMFAVLFPTPLTICLARRALVDDERAPGELHLLRMVPRAWLAEGKELLLKKLPTRFGPMSMTVKARRDGLDIDLVLPARWRPERVLLHRPPLEGKVVARVGGKAVSMRDGAPVELPAMGTIKVQVRSER